MYKVITIYKLTMAYIPDNQNLCFRACWWSERII
jgi:hypothetical protein